MKPPTVTRADRKALPLGELVGRGGEGEVFAVRGEDGLAVKLYTGGKAPAREDKVRAMVAADFASQADEVAYPAEVVLDQRGRFTGFVMRKVAKAKPLHQLYKPIARKKHFPAVDYRFVVHVAFNLAKAVASVHRLGCVIGDVNESGVLVTADGRVALIDADSFQVDLGGRRFGCEVGKPEYTAPELQNRSFRDVVRTRDHDTFALAVIVFQLLWMGRHPFSGVYSKGDMPLERSISERRFAYSAQRATGMAPPPGAPPLSILPPDMAAAFEMAFGTGSARPSAQDWVGLLDRLRQRLTPCRANPLHHYPSSAPECLWCAAARDGGVEMFVPPPLPVGAVPQSSNWSSGFDIVEVWRTIERVTAPTAAAEPVMALSDPLPSDAAKAARSDRIGRKFVGVLALVAAVGVLAWLAPLWPVWLGLAGFGVNRLFGAGDETRFTRAFQAADREWVDALGKWQSAVGPGRFVAAKEALADAKRRFEALESDEKRRLDEAQRSRRDRQLTAWLEQFQIRRFRIKGIGTSKVATLASFGIETAAEVERNRLLRVPGFGPVSSQPLIDWRRRLEARFSYDPRPNAADAQREASIRADVASKATALRQELVAGPARLAAFAKEVAAAQTSPSAELRRLKEIRLQAEVDLRHLGLRIPAALPVHTPTSPAARPVSGAARPAAARSVPTTGSVPRCPSCQSAMVRRTARRGYNAGNQFWGCSRYPGCKGTRSI